MYVASRARESPHRRNRDRQREGQEGNRHVPTLSIAKPEHPLEPLTTRTAVRPRLHDSYIPVRTAVDDTDLFETPRSVSQSVHVQDHLNCRGKLTVQRVAIHTAERRQRLESGRHLFGRIGVNGAGAAVVAGVHRREQISHLCAADLTDDDAIGTHS